MHQRQLSAPGSPDFCRLTYDEKQQWLHATWVGYVSSEYARQGATVGLEMLQQLGCPYLLNDNSRLEGPWFDSLYWLSHEWGPAAAQAGLRYVAHIAQPNTFATAYTGTPAHELFTQFEIQIFEDAAEAVEWLISCQQQEH